MRHNPTRQKAVFYHAGCPVCVDAERQLAHSLDPDRYDVEIVHLGDARERVAEAEASGVKSVPALVLGGLPLHINFGADIADLR
ncbi:MAG TPA: thioredoxin family protein [Lysobacter sp.]